MRGHCRPPNGLRLLQDFLDLNEGLFTLELAHVEDLDGSRPHELSSLPIQKCDLIAALPRTVGTRHPSLGASPSRLLVVLTAPPFTAQGLIRWSLMSQVRRHVEARSPKQTVSGFIALGDAFLFLSQVQVAGPAPISVQLDHVTNIRLLDELTDKTLSSQFSGIG